MPCSADFNHALVRWQWACHSGGSVIKALASGSPSACTKVSKGCAQMAGKEPHTRQSLRMLCVPKPGVSNKRKASAQALLQRF
jgi:hypothetical protein